MKKITIANTGAGAISGAAGAVIGLTGGPVGSIAGAIVGSFLGDIFKDVASRMLSHRERVRLDNATSYISDGIADGIEAGRVVRQDDFFEGSNNFSSDAAELLEGVLLKCKAQFQEKKVRLLANLFKNVAFNDTITSETAYQLLNLVDGFSYFQLCQIAYYGRRQEFVDFQILNDFYGAYSESLTEENHSAARDLYELSEQRIFQDVDGSSNPGEPGAVNPAHIRLATRGRQAFDLLELQQIPAEDVLKAIKPLEYQDSWGINSRGEVNGRK